MKRFTVAASLLLAGIVSAAETVNLEAGREQVLPVGHYDRVAVSHPEIATVSGAKEGLKVIGRSVGITTVLVWNGKNRSEYTVVVRGSAAQQHAAPANEEPTFELAPGVQRVISVPGLTRVAIGDPEIADVKPIGKDELLIVGAGEGKTTLLVWKEDGSRTSYLLHVAKPEAAVSRPRIELKVGETKETTFGAVSRIALGDTKVVDVELREKFGLAFHGLAEGQTTFIVWTNDGTRNEYDVVVSR